MAEEPLHDMLVALSGFFVEDASLEDTLTRVADIGVSTLPGADLAGLSLIDDGKGRTAVFTDRAAPEVDRAQYTSGNGPCLDAYRHRTIYRTEELASDDRWPEFARAAVEHGLHSTLSLPLVDGSGNAFGALNFYSQQPQAFPRELDHYAETFARASASVLANARAYWDAYKLSEGLATAMRSRAVIEQAKGVLIAQSGLTDEQAIDVLKRASQRENRKLREIAAEIVRDARERGSA